MGCWAIDAFGNDDAIDWSYGLEECSDLSLVEQALDKVLAANDDYLEATEANEALAAVEVIARLQGNWGERNSYTETADNWVKMSGVKTNRKVSEKSHRVIDRILADQSELKELWQETDEFDAWRASVEELRSRVQL